MGWCLWSGLRSFSCKVMHVGLGPCLSLHCHIISPGLRLAMPFPPNWWEFSYVERKQFWPRGNHKLFSPLLQSVSNDLSRALRGSHCQLQAVGRENPVFPAWPCSAGPHGHPVLLLQWHCQHCTAVRVSPAWCQETGVFLDVVSFVSKTYFLLLKEVDIRTAGKG